MIGFQVFRHIPTSLEINGPILSFSQQPTSVVTSNGESVTFVGIATAQFPTQVPANTAENTGYISYQWYEVGVGALSNSATITGTATTTLTISNLSSPSDNNRQFYLRADYIPSAYAIGKSTPNATNDFLDSNIVGVTVYPFITITSQPGINTAAQTRPATFSVDAITSDSTDSRLVYKWELNGSPLTDSSTITGSSTKNLSISLPNISTNDIRALITHPTASNSPIYTNTVNFNVVEARSILNYELLDDSANQYGFGSSNLFDQPITFAANPSTWVRTLVIYPPEKDITVKMTMAAASGAGRDGYRGGYGGLSEFTFTLLRNQEYVFKLGAQTLPSGGANGGGGGAFFYRKGQLLVALGGGGGAGSQDRGGDGGGIGVAGENGSGRSAGSGGILLDPGTLPVQGTLAGGLIEGGANNGQTTGGRVASCTIGDFWRFQGVSPCNDVGTSQFRGSKGEVAGSSASIVRGYKSGRGYRNNGGNGSGDSGGGGSGAVGGNAGTGSGSGGGGGSGYTNGEVNIIKTQLGGNTTTEGYVTIEYLS